MRISAEAPVNFAVAVLVADGLRIPPFDLHQPGDGVLRQVGLTEHAWWGWVGALAARQDEATHFDLQPTSVGEWQKLENDLEPLFRPAVLCPGPETLRSGLDGLWLQYRPSMDQWKRKVAAVYGGAFWAQVYRSLAAPKDITLHHVAYLAAVLHPISSTEWLLSIGDEEDARSVARRIEKALE